MTVLATERLMLRQAAESDVRALVDFFERNRDHLVQWEPPRPPDFYTEEFWRRQVALHRRVGESGTALMLFLFEKGAPDRIVGQISMTGVMRGPAQTAFLGYALDAEAEGKGYMHEALRAAIDHAFTVLNLHRLMANFQPTNVRSNRVLRRLGFTVEGYARDYLYVDGAWRDHVLTSLTNPDWHDDGF